LIEWDMTLMATPRTPQLEPGVSHRSHLPKLKVFECLAHALLIGLILGGGKVEARDRAVVRQFTKEHPCPIEGPGTCFQKGYAVDHVWPLVCGGPDTVDNLAYLNNATHAIKSRDDVRRCRGTAYGFWMRLWRTIRFWE